MTSTLLFALALLPGLQQNPSSPPPSVEEHPAPPTAPQEAGVRPSQWQIVLRAATPLTTTDPQHLSGGVGVAHTGTSRLLLQYSPSETGHLGSLRVAAGFRVIRRETWQLTFDLEHAQVRPSRRLFSGTGWQLEGHDRHQLSIAAVSMQFPGRRFLGLIDGVEIGGGQMHLWRQVSARAGSETLSTSRDPILESAAPVGMLGVRATRLLFWGLEGQAHVRLIGAGNSRGGEVPFAHVTAEWDVMRQMFRSPRFGRGAFGVSGHHASSRRAVSYFQNGVGLTFRIDF